MKAAIIIVAFNKPVFILSMIQAIDRFCLGKHYTDVIVVDNSWDFFNADIQEICKHHKCNVNVIYQKVVNPDYNNPSDSHAIALNQAYKNNMEYHFMLFLDHDCFPVNYFHVLPHSSRMWMLDRTFILGVHEPKTKLYPWVGYLMLYNEGLKQKDLSKFVDFSTNQEFGLDTGGNLYILIDKIIEKKYRGVIDLGPPEKVLINVAQKQVEYNQVQFTIVDNCFMHYINGSNWKKESEEVYNERIMALEQIRDKISFVDTILK